MNYNMTQFLLNFFSNWWKIVSHFYIATTVQTMATVNTLEWLRLCKLHVTINIAENHDLAKDSEYVFTVSTMNHIPHAYL